MAQIVNLTRMKKAQARAAADQTAAENRIRHGRTKAEKANDAREAARRIALLKGARMAGPVPANADDTLLA